MADDKMMVEYATDHGPVRLSGGIVRRYLASGGGNPSDQEVALFIKLCEYQKLNPFLREAYLVKYGDAPATLITGKDVFTKRAAKNENYNGCQSGIIIQTEAGLEYRAGHLLLKQEKLVGGWAKVYRKNWEYPVEVTVSFDEYAGRKRDGSLNRQWASMPATMIEKVAKVQALRDAFPEDFQGLYDASEMGNASEAEAPKPPQRPVEAPTSDSDGETVESDYEVVDEPSEAPENPLAELQSRASELITQVGEKNLMSDHQIKVFQEQIATARSDAMLRAMIKNFERQLATANQGEL